MGRKYGTSFSFNLLSQSMVAKIMWVTTVLQSLTQQLTYEVYNPEVTQPVFPECELSENQQTLTCLLLAWSVVCCCRQGCGRLLGLWTIKHKQKFTPKMAEWVSGSPNQTISFCVKCLLYLEPTHLFTFLFIGIICNYVTTVN